jgi:oligoribonuclease (3'-5' exoribonuclease)
MIIPVIDTETTAIKPENGELLSFACVLEDTNNIKPVEELPFFYCVFRHSTLKGEPYALNMNKGLIQEISEGKSKDLLNIENFTFKFNRFLRNNGLESHPEIEVQVEMASGNLNSISRMVVDPNFKNPVKVKACGKNFGTFDKGWIEQKIPDFNTFFQFNHRVMDVGPLFVDFKNDEWILNLSDCMHRAGVQGKVTHNALQDCYDLIKVLRTKY